MNMHRYWTLLLNRLWPIGPRWSQNNGIRGRLSLCFLHLSEQHASLLRGLVVPTGSLKRLKGLLRNGSHGMTIWQNEPWKNKGKITCGGIELGYQLKLKYICQWSGVWKRRRPWELVCVVKKVHTKSMFCKSLNYYNLFWSHVLL